jgi:hypothetical protein
VTGLASHTGAEIRPGEHAGALRHLIDVTTLMPPNAVLVAADKRALHEALARSNATCREGQLHPGYRESWRLSAARHVALFSVGIWHSWSAADRPSMAQQPEHRARPPFQPTLPDCSCDLTAKLCVAALTNYLQIARSSAQIAAAHDTSQHSTTWALFLRPPKRPLPKFSR